MEGRTSDKKGKNMSAEEIRLYDLAQMIDHSLLHPTLTDQDVVAGCELSRRYQVATACVKPYAVELAAGSLAGSGVKVCAVAGFPHGNGTTDMKRKEAVDAVMRGAEEIDMVVNVGKVLGEDWDYISGEIHTVNEAVVSRGALLKVIFENDFLEDRHIIRLCKICSEHQVAFVKTSTGYGFVKQENGMYTYRGAQDHHLRLMRQHAARAVRVKAAGGIRTLADVLRVRALGVTRIGATATEQILSEAKGQGYT